MWLARFLIYIFGAAALVAVNLDLGTFDPGTGDFDLAPVNLYALAGTVATFLAAVASFMGWGRGK